MRDNMSERNKKADSKADSKYDSVAILGAMDEEVENIAAGLENVTKVKVAGMEITEGYFCADSGLADGDCADGDCSDTGSADSEKLRKIRVAAAVSGMGTVNAACAAQCLIDKYSPDAVILSGIAGNLNKNLRINDIVLGKTMKYLDSDMRLIAQSAPFSEEFHADTHLLSLAEKVLDSRGINYVSGIIATGDRFIDDKEEAAKIREETGADAVEMEGAAICHAAARNGIPSLVIRVMSDNADVQYEVFKEFDISEFAHAAADIVLDILHNI